jgi:hypothetical protein
MPPHTPVDDEQDVLRHLNGAAVEEYRRSVSRYGDDVLREAQRLEASQRATRGEPEITSTMISDADTLLRRAYVRPQRPPSTIALVVISYVGAIGAGVGATGLDAVWGQTLFLASAVGGIVSMALAEIRK